MLHKQSMPKIGPWRGGRARFHFAILVTAPSELMKVLVSRASLCSFFFSIVITRAAPCAGPFLYPLFLLPFYVLNFFLYSFVIYKHSLPFSLTVWRLGRLRCRRERDAARRTWHPNNRRRLSGHGQDGEGHTRPGPHCWYACSAKPRF